MVLDRKEREKSYYNMGLLELKDVFMYCSLAKDNLFKF